MTQQTPFQFVLRNVSRASCSVRGYPRIGLLASGGVRVQFRYLDRGGAELTASSPVTVRLRPGARAYFGISKNSCVGPGTPVTGLVLGLPAGAGSLRVALPSGPELTHCNPGDPGRTVYVSPIERTLSAVHAPPPRQASAVAFRTASPSAVARFVTRTDRAMGGRYTASYRVALFKFGGRVFRGRVFVSQIPGKGAAFREQPGFSTGQAYAYELFTLHSYVSCTLPRRLSKWWCMSEIGEGMGSMSAQNDAAIPGAFTGGMDEAVSLFGSPALLIPAQAAEYTTPIPIFLSDRTVNGRAERCLSIGNAAGAVGRLCTTPQGVIVSYRLAPQEADNPYATAQLLGYTTKVDPDELKPPAKPLKPGDLKPKPGDS